MIYELRTYDMRPGSIEEFERRVEEAPAPQDSPVPHGGLLAHVHRPAEPGRPHLALRGPERQGGHPGRGGQEPQLAPQDPGPGAEHGERSHRARALRQGLEPAEIGPVFEIRIYTFQPGALPNVIEGWKDSLPAREKYSPTCSPATPKSAGSTAGTTSGHTLAWPSGTGYVQRRCPTPSGLRPPASTG